MDAKKTGELISSQRKKLGYTQSELGELIHVSDKAISRWETGRGFPDITLIEALCSVLKISSYELFKGECDEKKDVETEEVFSQGIRHLKNDMERKRVLSFVLGIFVTSFLLITLFFHLNAPIYCDDPDRIMKIETLNDGSLVLRVDKTVDDYESHFENGEDVKRIFISCYRTKIGSLKKERNEKLILLGNRDEIDEVWYYPSIGSDKLLYAENSPSYGITTLPRLIYNGWLLIASLCSLIFLVSFFVLRKRYFSKALLKYGLLPSACFLFSILVVLWGHFDQVYDALYYFTGILLLFIVLYGGSLFFLTYLKKNS